MLSASQLDDVEKLIQALLAHSCEIAKHEQKKISSIEVKPDQSLVTSADRAIETLMVEEIRRQFPEHQIVGEEYGNSGSPQSDYQWILDPIDGTQNFANGMPTYGIIMGLHYKGEPISVGSAHPAFNITYRATKGRGAWKNHERFVIREAWPLTDQGDMHPQEIIGVSTPSTFTRHSPLSVLTALESYHPTLRMYYDCFGLNSATEGLIGASVELFCKIWDFAAAPLLATEAGGAVHWLHSGGKYGYSAIVGKKIIVEKLAGFFASQPLFPK